MGQRTAFCVFEHVYFSRPDSSVFGKSVAESRRAFGRRLAREHPVPADIVVPVPDSGMFAALGFAEESGIRYGMGLVRNHYVGRTFIEPKQSIRNFGVKVKLNAVRSVVGGKRVVLVDDSIVRGTTSRKLVKMLKCAGASEVHLRISSPPTQNPCHYGIDTPRRKELIASSKSVEEIRAFIEADSLGYLSHEGMLAAFGHGDHETCSACFSGRYPVPLQRARPAGDALPAGGDADAARTRRPTRSRRPRPPRGPERVGGGGLELTADAGGTRLRLRVSAGASRSRVLGVHGGALKLSVKAPPERGKANREVLALVAEAFGLAASDVELVAGETSPDKVVRAADSSRTRRRAAVRPAAPARGRALRLFRVGIATETRSVRRLRRAARGPPWPRWAFAALVAPLAGALASSAGADGAGGLLLALVVARLSPDSRARTVRRVRRRGVRARRTREGSRPPSHTDPDATSSARPEAVPRVASATAERRVSSSSRNPLRKNLLLVTFRN